MADVATDEALRYKNIVVCIRKCLAHLLFRQFPVYFRIAEIGVGDHIAAYVDELVLFSSVAQVFRENGSAEKFSVRYDGVVLEVVVIGRNAVDAFGNFFEKRIQLLANRFGLAVKGFCDIVEMELLDVLELDIFLLVAVEIVVDEAFQMVGCLVYCRNYNYQFVFVLYYVIDILYCLWRLYRSTAEFIYLHKFKLFLSFSLRCL